MDNALIEEGSAELLELFDLVSDEAKIEKLGDAKPPINEILYWWTRKPLIVGRAVALTSTLHGSFITAKKLLNLSKNKRAFRTDPDLKLYESALHFKPSDFKVLDPFAGAGNLIFEAKRLGLDCTTLDVNPMAYLLQKAVLVYPAAFGIKLVSDVKKYATLVSDRARKELSVVYKRDGPTALAYVWTWCIKCPYCKQRMPLMNHMWFAHTKKRKIGFRITTTDDLNFRVDVVEDIKQKDAETYTQKGGKALCIRCRNSIGYDHLTAEIANRPDKELIGVVVRGTKDKDYQAPSRQDKRGFEEARNLLNKLRNDLEKENLIPTESIRESKRDSNLSGYGITKWFQFYNERQLVVMAILLKTIKQVCAEIPDREYAKIIITYLMFGLCKHADRNCLGITLIPAYGRIGHALGLRSPRIMYNFAETNPFGGGGGSWSGMIEDVTDAITFASTNKTPSKVTLGSVLHLPFGTKTFDLVVTDPPYMDDVAYGELSEFLYVWLYRGLKDYYPELPPIIPLDEDIVLSKGRFGDKATAYSFYTKAMKAAFKQISRVLKDDGLLVVFFAHSSTEAWNMLLEVLRESRMMVSSSYAMHTESTENPLARGKASFMSSIVVSCRKIAAESEVYFEDLMPQMEDKVKDLIAGISPDKLISIPMTDLLIMAYGEILEIATRHTRIKSFNPDFKPDFEILISRAREQIMKEILTRVLGRSPNILGPEISFYTIARLFYRGVIKADEAIKLNKAYGLQSNDLENKGIVATKEGIMRLLGYDEIALEVSPEEIESNNLHKQLICLQKVAAQEGANKVRKILTLHNFRANELAQIVSLLIKSYRFLQNKGEELDDIEGKEVKVLQDLADVLGVRDTGAKNLDGFIEK